MAAARGRGRRRGGRLSADAQDPPAGAPLRPDAPVALRTVLREWGRIGVIGFGGPPAHIALLRDLCVERRRWIDARAFEDANAACGLLPGPASTQMAIYLARHVAGGRGAVVGGIAFIVPGLLMVLALSAFALGDAPPAWVLGVGAGAGAAVIAVVAQAGFQLGAAAFAQRAGSRGALVRTALYVLAGGLAAALLGWLVVVVLLACGVVELVWRRGGPTVALEAATLLLVAWTAFKVGALSYGGGFVIIPLMQEDAVDTHGWMTQSEFLNGVAFGQLTPGPVVQTVATVGWAAAGLPGALLAAVVAFSPSFLVVVLGGPRFEALRRAPGPRAFLDGAGPAAVGAILGASVLLLGAIGEPWQAALLAAAALALVLRAPVALVLLGAALVGVAVALAGGPLP